MFARRPNHIAPHPRRSTDHPAAPFPLAAVLAITLPASLSTTLALTADIPNAAGIPLTPTLLSLTVHLTATSLLWAVLRHVAFKSARTRPPGPGAFHAAVLVAAAALVATDLLGPRLLGLPAPAEVVLLVGLRAVMTALVVAGLASTVGESRPDYAQRASACACALAPFLMLAAASMCDASARKLIVLSCVVGGVACLLIRQWLRAHGPRFRPVRVVANTAIFSLVILTSLVATLAVGNADDAHWFERGFAPTSGGVGIGSDTARSGLGEGPDQALGSNDPQSTGFDLGEIFVNSEEPSLYDAFTETFGEPRPPRDGHKLLSLDSSRLKMSAERLEQDLRNGRTLAIQRQMPSGPKADRKHGVDAILLVKADGPQHLRLAIYDEYLDGHWFPGLFPWTVAPLRVLPADAPPPTARADATTDTDRPYVPPPLQRNWLEFLDAPVSPALGGITQTQIRIGNLGGHTLPLGSNTIAFRLGLVDEISWFRGSGKWLVKLAARPIPPGAVLDLRSRPMDPRLRHRDRPMRNTGLPVDPVECLIRPWALRLTSHTPDPWEQVDAIVSAARNLGQYQRQSPSTPFHPQPTLSHLTTRPAGDANDTLALPDPDTDPVLHFIAHGGPACAIDYASTTALALRSLGFRVRLAAGFYANPDRLDPRSGLIPVTAADAHVWVEIATDDGAWVILEPTPTFLPPTPGFSLDGAIAGLLQAARSWAPHLLIASAIASLVWAVRRRLSVLLLLTTAQVALRCHFFLSNRPRKRIHWTLRFLELCHRSAGRPRPAHHTFDRFAQSIGLPELARLAAWAAYAPNHLTTPCPESEIRRVCIHAIQSAWIPPNKG